MYDNNVLEQIQLKNHYDLMYQEADNSAYNQEKELLLEFNSDGQMSKEELAIQIMEVRDNNESYKEQILEDKVGALEDLKLELHKELQSMAKSFEDDPDVKIVWDSADEKFYATQR
jgi:hypothetical protein